MSEPLYQIEFDKEDLIEVDGYYYVTDPEKMDDEKWQQEIRWRSMMKHLEGIEEYYEIKRREWGLK